VLCSACNADIVVEGLCEVSSFLARSSSGVSICTVVLVKQVNSVPGLS
jgi:hypothetical protein